MKYSLSEPLKLSLDKNYFLNVIKEIRVTDSFLSLDQETIGCQRDVCATRKFKDTLSNKCKCLPLQLRITDEAK